MNMLGQQSAPVVEAPVLFHRDELGLPSWGDRAINGAVYALTVVALVVSLGFLFVVA